MQLMTQPARNVSLWAPRALAILFALFLGVFALDVFGQSTGFLETLRALALHLMPTFLVLALLVLAWRREWIGGIGFAGLAVAYVAVAWGRFPWTTYAVIAGPLALLSALFLLSWRQRRRAGAAIR